MVTVTDFSVHEDTDERTFVMLKIEGGLSMVQSQTTGKFYMTVASAKIPCTFDETMAQSVIGNTIPGKIVRHPSCRRLGLSRSTLSINCTSYNSMATF